jgi:two-component system, chemotaxis family, protein-glutamate methylesterase/glutaminase
MESTDFPLIAIGAAAGALDAVRYITEALPRDCAAAIAVVFHTGPKLPVVFDEEGADLEPGRVYVAPPDHHMLLEPPGRIRVVRGSPIHNTRPAVDPLFASAAATFGPRVVGVVLSGRGKDGADGLRTIKNHGGLALVQDPVEAPEPQMPAAAFAHDDPEVLPIDRLARRVAEFCAGMKAA